MIRPVFRLTHFILLIFRELLVLCFAASYCLLWGAQESQTTPAVPAQTNESGYKLRVQTNVVIVPAAVRDSRGRAGDSINTPTLVLIDKAGTVRWIHQKTNYRVRVTIDEDLAEVRKLN
jgi:hypothetical protein